MRFQIRFNWDGTEFYSNDGKMFYRRFHRRSRRNNTHIYSKGLPGLLNEVVAKRFKEALAQVNQDYSKFVRHPYVKLTIHNSGYVSLRLDYR